MAKRLLSNHPHMKRFTAACDAFAKHGVTITFLGHRTLVTIDGTTYDVEDIEGGDQPLSEMPPMTEQKLVIGR